MFNFFKEKKLKKEIELLQLNNDFDINKSENYQLDSKETSPFAFNKYCFSAQSFDKRQTIFIQLLINSTQSEVILYYCEGFNKYYLEQQIYTNNCPLKITWDKDVINITFSGHLKKNYKDLVKASFSFKFKGQNDILNDKACLGSYNIYKSLINEKEYNHGLEKIMKDDYISYNQLGLLKGRMILEGQNVYFDVSCMRTHAYGYLNLTEINNYLNIIAIEKNNQFNFKTLSCKDITILDFGYYQPENKSVEFVTNAVYERQMLLKKTAPSYLNILLTLTNQQEISIHFKKTDEIYNIVCECGYEKNISICELLIDGKSYRGIIEYGIQTNNNRWFNGRDIKKLKI